MLRRILSLLLMPLVLASQGLVVAHSHQGNHVSEPAGHAARPHFHVGDNEHHHHRGNSHSHKHQHGNRSDHHHHSQTGHPDDEGAVADGLMPTRSHDDDAVYLPDMVKALTNRQSASDAELMLVLNDLPLWKLVVPDVSLTVAAGGYSQPPPLIDSGGPLYLRTLSLRL
jgi:hypothetical protein